LLIKVKNCNELPNKCKNCKYCWIDTNRNEILLSYKCPAVYDLGNRTGFDINTAKTCNKLLTESEKIY
jgi:hypothetical protein